MLRNLEPLADIVSGEVIAPGMGREVFFGLRKVVARVLVGQPAAEPELDDNAE